MTTEFRPCILYSLCVSWQGCEVWKVSTYLQLFSRHTVWLLSPSIGAREEILLRFSCRSVSLGCVFSTFCSCKGTQRALAHKSLRWGGCTVPTTMWEDSLACFHSELEHTRTIQIPFFEWLFLYCGFDYWPHVLGNSKDTESLNILQDLHI